MKVGGVICKDFFPKPSDLVKAFYDQGVGVVELSYDKRYSPLEVKKIKDFNLDFSLHCPTNLRFKHRFGNILGIKPKFYFKKYEVKEFEKGFQVAEKLGATHYVLHGGVFPRGYFRFKNLQRKKAYINTFIKSFKPLLMKGKHSKVKIVLENLTLFSFFSNASDIRIVKEKFPWIGFCFDFAHSELIKQTSSLKNLNIDHVHISDNNLKNDSHLAVGEGKLNFVKLIKILKSQNFDGKVICECKSIKEIVKSINLFKEKFLK